MKKYLMILLVTLLPACSAISLSDVSTGAGAVAGGVVANTLVPGSVAITSLGTVVGATAGATVIEDTVQTVTKDVIKEVTNPWQAFALSFQALLNHAFEIVIAIGIAVIGLPMIFSFVIGKVMPRRKEKDTMNENEILKKILKDKM